MTLITKNKMGKSLNIAFIGSVEFSEYILQSLLLLKNENIHICAIVSKSISKFNDDHCDLFPLAKEHAIPYLDYSESPDFLEKFLVENNPDVVYCFGWSHLISLRIMNAAPYGAIGFHPTKLPMHRGRHPIIWTLVLGLKETATTFFRIDEGADTGHILSQKTLPVLFEDTAKTLYKKIIEQSILQVAKFSKQLRDDNANFVPQDNVLSSYWRKRNIRDGLIDWRMSAVSIYNLIRALTKPYCGAQFAYKDQNITIWQSEVVDNSTSPNDAQRNYNEPGKVLIDNDIDVCVECGDHSILRVRKHPDFPCFTVGEFL